LVARATVVNREQSGSSDPGQSRKAAKKVSMKPSQRSVSRAASPGPPPLSGPRAPNRKGESEGGKEEEDDPGNKSLERRWIAGFGPHMTSKKNKLKKTQKSHASKQLTRVSRRLKIRKKCFIDSFKIPSLNQVCPFLAATLLLNLSSGFVSYKKGRGWTLGNCIIFHINVIPFQSKAVYFPAVSVLKFSSQV
jgi:hypothetical protein